MKICITARGGSLDSEVDPRFGRALYFLIVETETLALEVIPNPNVDGMGGVGIQSGQLISEKGVTSLLTGNVGPNAFQTLNAVRIDVITGVSGIVNEVVEKFKKGEYKKIQGPSVDSHSGMK